MAGEGASMDLSVGDSKIEIHSTGSLDVYIKNNETDLDNDNGVDDINLIKDFTDYLPPDDSNIHTDTAMSLDNEDTNKLEEKLRRLAGMLKAEGSDIESEDDIEDADFEKSNLEESASITLEERMKRLDNMLSSELNDKESVKSGEKHEEFQEDITMLSNKDVDASTLSTSKNILDRSSSTYLKIEDCWDQINRMLEGAGFSALAEADPRLLMLQLREIISQYEQRGEVVQSFVLNNSRKVDVSNTERLQAKIGQLERQLNNLKSENERMKHVLSSKSRKKAKEEDDDQSLRKKDVMELKLKLSHMEHKVKSKETIIEKLQNKLEGEISRLSSQKERSKEIFKDMLHKTPRKASTTDQKILDILGVVDAERTTNEKKIAHLKKQLRSMELLVMEANNKSSVQSEQETMTNVNFEDSGLGAELLAKEKMMVGKVAQLESNLSRSQALVERQQSELENLKLELASRPSMHDWNENMSKMGKLEYQLQCAAEIIEEKEAKENNIYFHNKNHSSNMATWKDFKGLSHEQIRSQIAKEADRRDKERYHRERLKDTRASIRQDRLDHELGLNSISSIPPGSKEHIIKSLCRLLKLSDPELLVPSIQKIIWVIQAMPRLEVFAKQVSNFVTLNSTDDGMSTNGDTLEMVLPQLKRWAADARFVHLFKRLREKLVLTLVSNDASSAEHDVTEMSDESLLNIVTDLIDLKRKIMGQESLMGSASKFLSDSPDLFVSQVLKHFQHLFDVREVQGILPKMNEIYVFLNEAKNFFQVLRPMIGVSSKASVQSCMSEIEKQLSVSGKDTISAYNEPMWS